MPWRGPRYPGEFPTLGYGVLDWMSSYLPSPRDANEPLVLTNEQARLVLLWYAIDPERNRFLYRRWLQERAKGWGKGPMMAALCLAELGAGSPEDSAPVMFDGWDGDGEPVGRPWGTGKLPAAWIQIAALSEDQTSNTMSPLYEMLVANEHHAAIALGIDDARTRLYLKGRPGQLERVTSSSGSREGQPITKAILDETQLYTASNGGVKLARTIRRNAAKMNGRTVETANAPQLGLESVAEMSGKAAEKGAAGILYDAVRPLETPEPDWSDAQMLSALDHVYGDSWWVPKQRLLADIRDPATPWADSLRFFFNVRTPGGGRAVDPRLWDELAEPRDIPAKARIGLGFDGSISRDATVLRACTSDGYGWLVKAWQRPEGAIDWTVPRKDVHEAIADAFGRYSVGRMYADPPRWWDELEGWAALYGEKRVLGFDTKEHRSRMSAAVDRWLTAIRTKSYRHDGDALTSAHVKAAQLKRLTPTADDDDGRTRYVLEKSDDGGRIDAAVADVLAYEAAMTMAPSVDRTVHSWS